MIVLQKGVDGLSLFLQQVLNKDGGITFTCAIGTVHPQTAADIRRFIAKRLTEKVHQLFHVVTDNILTPEILIAAVGIDIHNRFKGRAYLQVFAVFLRCHNS